MPPHLTLAQAAALLETDEAGVLDLVRRGLLDQRPEGVPLAQVAELLALRERERTAGRSPP